MSSTKQKTVLETLTEPEPRKKSWWRRFFVLLGLLMLVLLMAAWFQRQTLAEYIIRQTLENQGIETELVLTEANGTQAVFENVILSKDGKSFFSADKISTQFAWRELFRDRKIKRVDVAAPQIVLSLNAKGEITDNWAQGDGSGDGQTALPENGIAFSDARITLNSPYGVLKMTGTGDVNSPEDVRANFKIAPSDLIYEGSSANVAGDVKLVYHEGLIDSDLDIEIQHLSHKDIQAQDFQLSGNVKLDKETLESDLSLQLNQLVYKTIQVSDLHYSGKTRSVNGVNHIVDDFDLSVAAWSQGDWAGRDVKASGQVETDADMSAFKTDISLNVSDLSSPDVGADHAHLTWKGDIQRSTHSQEPDIQELNIRGVWKADIDGSALKNNVRREGMAQTLTMNETFSNISSTAPFATRLTKMADDLLRGHDLTAAGDLAVTSRDMRLTLSEELRLVRHDSKAIISLRQGRDFYSYSKADQKLVLAFNAQIDGSHPVILDNAELTARSLTGLDFDGVSAFKADASLPRTWEALTAEGKKVRLAPTSSQIDYRNTGLTRHVRMSTDLDYDGDIPGGYVKGLNAKGDLKLTLKGENLFTEYTPATDQPITIDRLENVSDWIAEDLSLTLEPSKQVYWRNEEGSHVKADIQNVSGSSHHKIDSRAFDFAFEQAAITGLILEEQQDWDIAAQNAQMTSETLPSPGTNMRSPDLDMTIALFVDKPLEFTIDSPVSDVQTELVDARGLHVKARGTPDHIKVEYDEGEVKFAAGELPVLPLVGDVEFLNNIWTGSAQTYLPRAEDTPILVNYKFDDGIGSADIEIVDLPFERGKLQPSHLVSAFSGKIADVNGLASANIQLMFGADQPLTSSGRAIIKDMDFGTLPGPVSGLDAELEFSSIFPLQSQGIQSITIKNFDPGLPLENGRIEYEFIPDGIKIHSARWPLGAGFVSMEPAIWLYTAPENKVTLRVEKVAISDFLNGAGGENLDVTGDVYGELPVTIAGVSVNVDGGVLSVPNGGNIQFKTGHTDAAAASNEYAGYAFDALKNLDYREFEVRFFGPLDGDMQLKMVFDGSNPDLLGGAQFIFNVDMQGELLNIARTFQPKHIQEKAISQFLEEK